MAFSLRIYCPICLTNLHSASARLTRRTSPSNFRQMAWNVPMVMRDTARLPPSCFSSRCRISAAAWLVKVTAVISEGFAPVSTRRAIRAASVPEYEMARDEARHGKAFEGLLKRYFG